MTEGMMNTRRSFLQSAVLGSGALALSPSFNHLLGAVKPDPQPHRFIFIRKSNGNIPSLFSLPTFSEEQKKKDKDKESFEADLDKHELPQWMRALATRKT